MGLGGIELETVRVHKVDASSQQRSHQFSSFGRGTEGEGRVISNCNSREEKKKMSSSALLGICFA